MNKIAHISVHDFCEIVFTQKPKAFTFLNISKPHLPRVALVQVFLQRQQPHGGQVFRTRQNDVLQLH